MLNLNKNTKTKYKPNQHTNLRTVHMCVHIYIIYVSHFSWTLKQY